MGISSGGGYPGGRVPSTVGVRVGDGDAVIDVGVGETGLVGFGVGEGSKVEPNLKRAIIV